MATSYVNYSFGRWTVIAEAEKKSSQRRVLCRCDCGTERELYLADLLRNDRPSKSCGCLLREVTIRRSTKHGQAKRGNQSRTYRAWCDMIKRCEKPSAYAYRWYGGVGVTICHRWRESFEGFLEDMGECPEGLTLDRIDPFGNYSPDNCRWATWETQRENKRRNRVRR